VISPELQHWNCERCNGYNDYLEEHCSYCHFHSPDYVTFKSQAIVQLQRGVFYYANMHIPRLEQSSMTEQEALFAKLYNGYKIRVSEMTDEELAVHIAEISDIAFKAKVGKIAADDEKKERISKRTPKGKEFSITSNEPDGRVSDSINAVKVRQNRKTKLDKMYDGFIAAGIPEETAQEMIRNLERKATDAQVNSFPVLKEIKSSVNITIPQPVIDDTPRIPFDPSKLVLFGK